MYNATLKEAMEYTTADEKAKFELIHQFLQQQGESSHRATTANAIIQHHFGATITACYAHLLQFSPEFKRLTIEQGQQ